MKGNIDKGNMPFWQKIAYDWDRMEPPFVMDKGETAIYRRFIKKYQKKGKRALLLGATPQLRDILYGLGYETTLIDISPNMIKGMTSLLKKSPRKERIIVGNWLDLGSKIKFDERFDLVIGDHFLSHISPDKYLDMMKVVSSQLKQDGLFVTNVFLRIKEDFSTEKAVEKYRKDRSLFRTTPDKMAWFYKAIGNDKDIFDSALKKTNWAGYNVKLKKMLRQGKITEKEFKGVHVEDAGEKEIIISFMTEGEFKDIAQRYFKILDSDNVRRHKVFRHHRIYAMKLNGGND